MAVALGFEVFFYIERDNVHYNAMSCYVNGHTLLHTS